MLNKIPTSHIHLYGRFESDLDFSINEIILKKFLTEDEILRGKKIKDLVAKNRFFKFRIFIKKALLMYLELESENKELVEFSYGQEGKPFLKNYSHLHFNFSHTHKAVFLAISSTSLGIDAEYKTRHQDKSLEHLNRLFSFLDSSCPSDFILSREDFISKWTAMEASLKFYGWGLGKGKHVLGNKNDLFCYEISGNGEFSSFGEKFQDYVVHLSTKEKDPVFILL